MTTELNILFIMTLPAALMWCIGLIMLLGLNAPRRTPILIQSSPQGAAWWRENERRRCEEFTQMMEQPDFSRQYRRAGALVFATGCMLITGLLSYTQLITPAFSKPVQMCLIEKSHLTPDHEIRPDPKNLPCMMSALLLPSGEIHNAQKKIIGKWRVEPRGHGVSIQIAKAAVDNGILIASFDSLSFKDVHMLHFSQHVIDPESFETTPVLEKLMFENTKRGFSNASVATERFGLYTWFNPAALEVELPSAPSTWKD